MANMTTAQTNSEDAKLVARALISLVVATYGRGKELQPLMTSLAMQTDRRFEVIVVDQNADDRIDSVVEVARGSGLTVYHLHLDTPGLSSARNLGTALALGSIVAYPDDDCWYEPDVLARVRAAFEATPDATGIVGRWVEVEVDGPRPAHRLSYDAWSRFRGGYAASITLFFRLERLQAFGGFDPRLGAGRWYGSSEETDLLLRMLQADERIEHAPDIQIHHPIAHAPSRNRASLKRARAYGRGIGALYSRHRLSAWVKLRGLTAPLLQAMRAPRPFDALAIATATILGRVEGLVRWSLIDGRNKSPVAATTAESGKIGEASQ
jgi:glycosyltransferase involved in cell wall biosynthesis